MRVEGRASQIDAGKSTSLYWYDANGHPLTSTTVRLCWLLLEANATTYLTGPNWAKYAPNLKEVLNNHGIELEEVK